MNDPEIRKLLFQRLNKNRKTPFNIYEEVPLTSGLHRADVVVVGRHLECFEIKGKNDTLKRLIDQAAHYQQCFDRVSLICATKHISKAMMVLPEWWGIIEVTDSGELVVRERPKTNPALTPDGMVDLMMVDEAKLTYKQFISPTGISNLSRSRLQDALSKHCSIDSLRYAVKHHLAARDWNWFPSKIAAG